MDANLKSNLGDAGIAIGAITILVVMVVPLPTIVLDLLLTLSITIGVVILLVSMYILHPTEITVFPSLLLIITIFRLSLNVASTRLILLNGGEGPAAAGQVIKAFGQFVVGGNYVVGAVIFLILVLINFMVITKGSVRASEVAARFTLDAIPGKQMSIDADLNAGIIDEEGARTRRQGLEQEANFYGSMDGSIRFIRGDAIAGIIITLINVIGGFLIGVSQEGMSFTDALQVYTLLTIGDGLVAQMPALIVSTASGIIVTRSAASDNLAAEVTKQFLLHPRAFAGASVVLFLFATIPGLPHTAFFVLGVISAGIAFVNMQAQKIASVKEEERKEREESQKPVSEKVESLLPLDTMELEVGYELIPLVDASQAGDLLERIKSLRRQFALEMGIIVPPLHIRDNLQLKSNEYSILIKGVEVAKGSVVMNNYRAMDPGTGVREVNGIPTKEPAFGLPALWVSEAVKEEAKSAGYTVVDVTTVITTHLKEIIRKHSHELLGRQDVQSLVDSFKEKKPKVVEELIPSLLSLGTVQKVLHNLLKEGISIRDLQTILETLSDHAAVLKDPDMLTEYVRQSLARPITKQYANPEGSISVLVMDKEIEDLIESSVQQTPQGTYLALDPGKARTILTKIKEGMEKISALTEQPVVLTSPQIRMHLRKLTERFIPNLVVISHNEVSPEAQIDTLGVVSMA
ncbi:MAG: flagellar biosynthesis protein FlhA [Nitrospinota bacterium]